MLVRYVGIRWFVWMLISSEITGNYQRLPEVTCGGALSIPRLLLRLGVGFRLQSLSGRKPAMISSTWCWFQTVVAIKQETGDDIFDLATVSGVFGKHAKKSKLVVWLV